MTLPAGILSLGSGEAEVLPSWTSALNMDVDTWSAGNGSSAIDTRDQNARS